MMSYSFKKNTLLPMVFILLLIILPSTNIAQNVTILSTDSNETISLFFDPDIVIPDHYPTIQEGINNADPGSKIFVRSGIYKENIIIDKVGICLRGENKLNTTIDGGKTSKNTITISSQDITIQGFSIINGQNAGEGVWDTAGIRITSSNVTIKDNLIMWNLFGINVLDIAHNLTITDNSFTDDSILLGNYEYTNLKLTKESFQHNITNNTVNGKPIYYYKNEDNFTVPNDAGQIILANCTNAKIKDTYLTHADFPVILGVCSNCIIENLTVDNSGGEIILFKSNNCTIQNNTISNLIFGICIDYRSENNIIQYNKVKNSSGGIVVMTSSRNNTVYKNNVCYNRNGIVLLNKTYDNLILDNKICHNTNGIKLAMSPFNNTIKSNIIKKCQFLAVSMGQSKNNWDNNYWNRPRIFPKLIFAYVLVGQTRIPYFIADIDWHPARKL